MKIRILFILLSGLVSISSVNSQNEIDALRYSQTYSGGTARYLAMGGAFGSLGADFSTVNTNPAGLGLYKKSEFSISPAFFVGRTDSDYNGNNTYDSQNNFNLSSVGYVYASPPKTEKGLIMKNFQFAFGVHRTNNFNNRMLIEGYNSENSIVDTYVDNAEGVYYQDIEDNRYGYYGFDLYPAWHTYMIDTIPGYTNSYFGAVPAGGGIYQRKEVNNWGSVNDFLFALAANIGDRFYMGASFNFPAIRYFNESIYTESDIDNNIEDFDELTIYENLTTRGNGFNLKFGMTVRATDFFRFGAAIHSPTWYYNMRDEWYSEFTTRFDNNDSYSKLSPMGNYSYQLNTPWKALGSVSLVLWRMALISAEYEYIDYSESKLRSSGYSYYDENQTIQTKYTYTHNIKLGVEIRMGHFALRGGASYDSSPYANEINDGERYSYSGGFGFRDENFFLDFAYIQSHSKEDYYLYGSENVSVEPVKNNYITHNVVLTLGFRM